MSDDTPVKRFLEAVRSGDPQGAMAVLHPEVTVSEPAGLVHGGEYRGIEEFVGVMQTIFENYRVEIIEFRTIDGGDVTVAIVDCRWTSVATGRTLPTRFCELYTTSEGSITSIEVFPKDTRGLHELTQP